MPSPPPDYGARAAYASAAAGEAYGAAEGTGGRGPLGRYRRRREREAVASLLATIPAGAAILDCPCGNGRWFPMLAARAGLLVGLDYSPGMLDQAAALGAPVRLLRGEAERLPLADGAVDAVFSFALTKHLPWPVQDRVLAEFARVSRRAVICSFGLLTPLSYALWRRRGLAESYPLLPEQLDEMAARAGLAVRRRLRCSTPLGVEHLVLMERR